MVRTWLSALLALLLSCPAGAQDFWVDGRRQHYSWLSQATQPWRICALLPQGQDGFWWGVSWGLAEQARALNVNLGIYVAAGYGDAAGQARQWRQCRLRGAQAFIVAAVDATSLQAEIRQAMAAGMPVIDLLNGVTSRTTASALGYVPDMIDQILDVLLKDSAGMPQVTVAWFPGPSQSIWADEADETFRRRLRGIPSLTLRSGGRGATDMQTQATLVRSDLERFGAPDYVVGNAMAVEFAARFMQSRPGDRRSKLLAFYGNEAIVTRVGAGEVMATVNNQPLLQARLAVDLAVRALQKLPLPSRVAPVNLLLDASHLDAASTANLLPPPGQRLVRQELR